MKLLSMPKLISILAVCTGMMLCSIDVYGQTAQEFYSQGNQLYNQKKYAEAVASYIRAIQSQPKTQPKAYLNCARAYSMQKNYAAAVKYYEFYAEVEPSASTDKKYKAEYKDAQNRAKNTSFVRDNAQTTVLKQLETQLLEKGPYLNRQGNGALAYYDVLIRAGYAEPHIYDLQKTLVLGLSAEIESDIQPPNGQPLPNLDRTGWEFIRNKLEKTHQFADVPPDNASLAAIESTAQAWESYYKGNYQEAKQYFDTACQASPAIPAAYWGRMMLAFQQEDTNSLLSLIDETEKVYQSAGISSVSNYFLLLRAEAYRAMGDIAKSFEWLDKFQGAL